MPKILHHDDNYLQRKFVHERRRLRTGAAGQRGHSTRATGQEPLPAVQVARQVLTFAERTREDTLQGIILFVFEFLNFAAVALGWASGTAVALLERVLASHLDAFIFLLWS